MVDYRTQGQIAILEVNNPPVNALSIHVRKGLDDGISRAVRDPSVKAVIVIGKGRTFSSGADIKEFNKPQEGPRLTMVGKKLEESDKPVVAAIHGTCLGGGLEIALFCHYRIAVKSARVGFPEVLLGILPGAAGTQRLPRVTDVAVAMEMISTGKHVPAPKALEYGILDKIVQGDLLEEAVKFAKSVMGKPVQPCRLSDQPVKGADRLVQVFDAAMRQVKQRQRGFMAPVVCLKAVRSAAELPYNEGLLRENTLFTELMSSSQCAALRYAFFAERAAQRWQLPSGASAANTKPVPVKSTGVIGAGTMGQGIAICLLRVDYPVILVEQNQKLLDKGVEMIQLAFKDAVRRKLMTEDAMRHCMSNISPTVDMQQLANVDLVIEAVYENVALKQDIFRKLDVICKPSAVLCTNTSTISIDIIASATKRPGSVVGTHFFAPAHIMRLLENVYSKDTSAQAVATVMDLGKKIGKVSVLVKTCHGFVANRMFHHQGQEAALMLEEGALPEHIDKVMEDFGMSIGPMKVSDLSGVDIGWRIRHEVAKMEGVELTSQTRFFRGERYCTLPDKLYELGRLGRKTGKGWYRYEKPGGRVAMVDDEVTNLIKKHSAEMGIERRGISTQEIQERILYPAINEGFRILEEGVAAKPEDIDVIWWYGFSFPRYMGGPMFHASQVGLSKVYERICYYHQNFPYSSHWVPSDLLRKLASAPSPVPISQWMSYSQSKL
ncbi:peroxisomal bifunctional enzyme-like [Littorina saxatilis]|uniref:Peroxisomal bifunctional enzyme n=1 Tax=Littorina saxatilis TaxID=31220 RepID=A0AAN9GJV5_9CAEN